MYEELVKRLRTCGSSLSCNKCKWSLDCGGSKEVILKAADAIADLQEKLDDARMDASELAESLEYMSAADVRPVRLGKLEKYGAAIRCSECGFDTQSWDVNFCPNCGAKMEEDPFVDSPPMEYFESGGI